MKRNLLAAVMITIDRRVDRTSIGLLESKGAGPSVNYLRETLENLKRSDLLTTPHLAEPLFISCSDDGEWAAETCHDLGLDRVGVGGHLPTVCANRNVAAALRYGSRVEEADWVLFLEDDIDVCRDFFSSVIQWLDDNAREDRLLYPLGAAYPQPGWRAEEGWFDWDYPIAKFYGTQGVAMRREDAADLALFLEKNCYSKQPDGTAWDLLMSAWSRERRPEVDHFLTPAPSFVQHIGRESIVRPRSGTHSFPSWPGREWSYLKARQRGRQGMKEAVMKRRRLAAQ